MRSRKVKPLRLKEPSPLFTEVNNVEYLTEHWDEITKADLQSSWIGNTPLLAAIANSCISFALRLLDHPDTTHINIKAETYHIIKNRNTPLILATAKGWNHRNTDGNDTLQQRLVIEKLLTKKARVNETDWKRRSALHYACLHRNIEAIRTLVRYGADWEIKDADGLTPLDYCYKDYEAATKILSTEVFVFTLEEEHFTDPSPFYESLTDLRENGVSPDDCGETEEEETEDHRKVLAKQETVDSFKSLVTEINNDILGRNYTSRWTHDVSGPKIQLLLKLEILTQMPTFTPGEFVAFLILFQSVYEIKRHSWNFFASPHSAQKFQGWLKEHFSHPIPSLPWADQELMIMLDDEDLWGFIQDMADHFEEARENNSRSSLSPD